MIRIFPLHILLVLLPFALFGQTDIKSDKESFREHLKTKEAERKKAVVEYAEKNGIPITGTGTKGEFMYLHHITNDRPVYYTTRGNDTTGADIPFAYIKMGDNEWRPLENDVRLEMLNNTYISVKSDEEIIAAYILNSDGKYHYKTKNNGTKELRIPTHNIDPGEYVVCIKTAAGLRVFNIVIY